MCDKLFDSVKNSTIYSSKYKTSSEAVIVSCYFNPLNSPYRLKAFNYFYESIKHLPHRIIECVIGDSKPQLPENKHIQRLYTPSLLWHKESLLNKIVAELPDKFKYVFWVDADVIFTNLNWLIDGVEVLRTRNIIQPFDYCVHLEQDEYKPRFSLDELRRSNFPNQKNSKVWRSFCSNYSNNDLWKDLNYDNHGHVGFAWGARREILESVPLYDRALVGGADHIIAHAAAGQIPHPCITKSFTDNINEVTEWSQKFSNVVKGSIGFVPGGLYHIWHGDIDKRQYLKRIQDFTPMSKNITERDRNGLFVARRGEDVYVRKYFGQREVRKEKKPRNKKPHHRPTALFSPDFGSFDNYSNNNSIHPNSSDSSSNHSDHSNHSIECSNHSDHSNHSNECSNHSNHSEHSNHCSNHSNHHSDHSDHCDHGDHSNHNFDDSNGNCHGGDWNTFS